MDERKLRDAFSKIKEDMNYLRKKVETIETRKTHSSSNETLNSIESELTTINSLVDKLTQRFDKNSEEIKEFKTQISQLKDQTSANKKEIHNEDMYIRLLDEKLQDFQELINEKISLEISSLKIDFETRYAELSEKFSNQSIEKNLNQTDLTANEVLSEVSEVLNERITLEINSLKLEFTEEIAKVYDRCFNEILEIKDELRGEKRTLPKKKGKVEDVIPKNIKISKHENNKKETKQETQTKPKKQEESKQDIEMVSLEEDEKKSKKEGKFKKIAKWLFIDEDEDSSLDEIKGQISDKEKKK